jgi:hypothetical protein
MEICDCESLDIWYNSLRVAMYHIRYMLRPRKHLSSDLFCVKYGLRLKEQLSIKHRSRQHKIC